MARRRTFFSKKVYSKTGTGREYKRNKKKVEELGEIYTHTTGWEIRSEKKSRIRERGNHLNIVLLL